MLALVDTVRAAFRRKPPFPFYPQHDGFDCGPACLRMIAKHYGRSVSLPYLRELAYMDRQGVSLLGLSDAAEQLGFRTLSVKVTFDKLAAHAPLPCIAHWQQKHFIIVYAVAHGRVYTADPSGGLVAYREDEFIRGWCADEDGGQPCGVLLLLEPAPAFYEREEEDAGLPRRGGLRALLPYLRPYRRLLGQLLVGAVVLSLLQLLLPFLTQALVDTGIANQDLGFVYLILLAQLMLVLSRAAVDFIQSWILLHVGARIDIAMISDFLIKLMRLPVAFFDSKTTGDLLQRVQDHDRVQAFLAGTSLHMLLSLLSLLVFSVVLTFYSLQILALFAAGSLLYVGYVAFFLRRRRELDYKRFSQLSDNQNLLIEAITGMAEIKLNGAEQQKRWAWERLQARVFRISLRSLALDQYQQGGALFIHEVKNILITIVAVQQVIAGHLTLGGLLAVQYILGQLNGPLNGLIGFMHAAQDAKISLDRLGEVHAAEDEEQPDHALAFLPAEPDLRLRGVSFRYGGPHDPPVLRDVDLTLPHGKTTAIVGTSGSGKTTLMRLLLKIHTPHEGEIRLGDVNLRNLSHRFWRAQCGVVLQDGQIFSDTIAANVALGHEHIDRRRLLEAVRIAGIQSFIETLPLAYNTRVGQDGVGLSQGQRQRLLIARAVYKDPRYLFFDEATSALDAETERTITENLQTFLAGRTAVIIAHRLSTVRHADQIVVLEGGRIVEHGPHEALVARRGRYFNLVRNQLELGA